MQELVLRLVNQTNLNVFLTGKAGTGKTTLLHQIVSTSHKNTVVVAPTGIAAINAKGVTIHSFFQLPFASFIPRESAPEVRHDYLRFEDRRSLRHHFKMRRPKEQLIRHLELLIIDEVSMLRADILDAINYILQTIRQSSVPFGGVQVLCIGDLLQLPPVVKPEEWEILKQYYEGMYFFQSQVVQSHPLVYIELEHVYRQSDPKFISILNNLRHNRLTPLDLDELNRHVRPNYEPEQDTITLTTHNALADEINEHEMQRLVGSSSSYEAVVEGEFPESMYPIEPEIQLKEGARVMFIKNDPSPQKLFFNGKMGTVVSLEEDRIEIELDGGCVINVDPYEWEHIRYHINEQTKAIESQRLGTFSQYPLRLAWAITIHKSQGLTFERAALDLNRVFASGQAYVALSRLRSLQGLVLYNPLQSFGIRNSPDVERYALQRMPLPALQETCSRAEAAYLQQMILDCYQWQELREAWTEHEASYIESDQSPKSRYHSWAKSQLKQIEELASVSGRFAQQLYGLFASQVHWEIIEDRLDKALAYFVPSLENIWYEVLRVEAETKALKKVKQYHVDLELLEEHIAQIVRRLLKTRQMVQAARMGKMIDATSFDLTELTRLQDRLNDRILEYLQEQNLFELVEDKKKKTAKAKKQKQKATEHISTYETTWALWQTTHSVAMIAEQRMLTETTIYRHLAKLIEEGKISVDELLSAEAIQEISNAFAQSEDTKLTTIHELLQGQYSWDELFLFKASLNRPTIGQ